MSYTREEAARHRMFFERAPDREKQLIEQAEMLIAERAKKTGMSPQKLINAIFNEPEEPKSKQRADDDSIAAELVRRLGRRDKTGAGSGRDVDE